VATVRIAEMLHARTALACGFSAAAVALAPGAVASPPDCVQTGPRTTQCTTSGGSTQIVTSPPPNTANQWNGYGWGGGWGLSFGGGGINVGGRR
jgi:hypothetical protein